MEQTVAKDVEIRNIYKSYGSNVILNGINLEVRQGELLTLLGPSGCGKTTTLNVIAGFINPDRGDIYIKGSRMNGVPTYKRDLGMVFQTYSLFPHKTVYQNLDFGLSIQKIDKKEKKRRIENVLELVKMGGMESRYPRELSGGQRQRVAIARALVVQPKLLLLDEPLSNLDAKLRLELRTEIKRLQKEIGLTTLFVTHDQEEALSMSDRIILMNGGKIEQAGTPSQIYEHPQTEFVFQFIGKSNSLEGRITSVSQEMVQVKLDNGAIVSVAADHVMGNRDAGQAGDKVKLYIRPEKVEVVSGSSSLSPGNSFKASVRQMNYLGAAWEVELTWMGVSLQALCPKINPDWIHEGEVNIGWKLSDMMLTRKT
ncbi:ABC transporter ATP-binding protein [Paenibacillus piri]|uniref:Carnitine transport ATP-binding protein OpuCA n=1 Tax=Paenibacillus piri TaxID=2547395 RepID=A0A4R5K6I7_9BACL|nr:ABC transporter ATP-binding protein [Paenibacillus piri]TDF89727.1 ABC transporter ATP-binding protein [Paenibacillus piri]